MIHVDQKHGLSICVPYKVSNLRPTLPLNDKRFGCTVVFNTIRPGGHKEMSSILADQ